MNKITDKLAILFISVLFTIEYSGVGVCSVSVVLISVSLSAISQYFSGSRISLAVQFIYIILCVYSPVFCCMLPLMFYDIMHERTKYTLVMAAIVFVIDLKNFKVMEIMILLSCLAVSFLLEKHSSELADAKNMLIKLRDNSEEVNILLTEKNRYLHEQMNQEVNIAVLSERNRIAREIHDNVGHMLSRTLLQMGALMVINKDENVRTELENVKGTLNEAMTSIRESVHNLHDDSVDLKSTVTELTKTLGDHFNVNLDMDFSENISKEIKFCFIGIVKESISNIIKHSNGDCVYITIREHPAFCQLVVEDNGENDGTVSGDGIGLENMKNRAESLGGIFKYYCEKNKFKIFVSIKK